MFDTVLSMPRAGWVKKGRDIPVEIAETTGAHCLKTAIATELIISGGFTNISTYRKPRTVIKA